MMGEEMRAVTEIRKQAKYIVFKIEDVEGLSPRQRRQLNSIHEQIQIMRRKQGRPEKNRYVICNQDEPYAEELWQLIIRREREKLNPPKEAAPK